MTLIAHRGNTAGKNPDLENTPAYIDVAVAKGYDVEVDVWYVEDKYYLGHDSPEIETTLEYLDNDKFWCHCKNVGALAQLVKHGVHCFFHQSDDVTLTSRGILWTFPKKELMEGSVCVMPELGYTGPLDQCSGICSDFVEDYKA
tara:strand:- start:1608 stop:2039 length:432 start_codon:yes stop_codon:yes gene_type:complete